MNATFFAAFVIGGLVFCYVRFLTEEKDWEDKGGREMAAVKAGLFMFMLVAALAGLGFLDGEFE